MSNKTGVVVGRLSDVDLEILICDVENREMKKMLLRWYKAVILSKKSLVVSEALEGEP